MTVLVLLSERYISTNTRLFQCCDWHALDILFYYHGDQLLPHRLALLRNFPETYSPEHYASLLPEAMPASDDVKQVAQQPWREQDWVDADDVSEALDLQAVDTAAALYEDSPDVARFRGDVTRATLTEWYLFRAAEIERLSKQVDHALALIELGIDRCVPGLDACRDNWLRYPHLCTNATSPTTCHLMTSARWRT